MTTDIQRMLEDKNKEIKILEGFISDAKKEIEMGSLEKDKLQHDLNQEQIAHQEEVRKLTEALDYEIEEKEIVKKMSIWQFMKWKKQKE